MRGTWQLGIIGAFLLVYSLTVLLTGNAEYLVVTALLAAIVLAYAAVNMVAAKRIAARHGSIDDAMSDETESFPSAHLITDDTTPAGDTPEAHDEINPHDLPRDHPGRHAAEDEAADNGGVTAGNEEGPAGGRFDRTGPGNEESDATPMRPGQTTRPVS